MKDQDNKKKEEQPVTIEPAATGATQEKTAEKEENQEEEDQGIIIMIKCILFKIKIIIFSNLYLIYKIGGKVNYYMTIKVYFI